MVTVNELYKYLENAVPGDLSCDWDNDGKMVLPCPDRTVKKVLITLDITESAVDYAADKGFDCIISHHPLIFSPLKNIDFENNVGRKVCKLIKNGRAAFSFHTRLDKVSGGVNDALADLLGLKNVNDFSDVGRMGETDVSSLRDFAEKLKKGTGSDRVVCVYGGRAVKKVALVGGCGKGYLEEAYLCGCDTFLTGEMAYNYEIDAKEMGINLIYGGHYFTENGICKRLALLIENIGSGVKCEMFESNPAFSV